MLFYVIILGFGALAGIIINILINQKNLVYTIIGSIVILFTGAFACFVLYYPFYFDSFRSLITTLMIATVFFIVIYVALRLIVNTVVPQQEPITQPDADSRRQMSKQPTHNRSSYTGRIGKVKTKTIENVEVTRINKSVIQSVKTAELTASKAPASTSVSTMRTNNIFTADKIEPARAAFTPTAVSGVELKARLPETAAVQVDEETAIMAEALSVPIPRAIADIPVCQEAAHIEEQPVPEPEAAAALTDEEAVDSLIPAQELEAAAIPTDDKTVDAMEISVRESDAASVLTGTGAIDAMEIPAQELEAAAIMGDDDTVDSVEIPFQEPEADAMTDDITADFLEISSALNPEADAIPRDDETVDAMVIPAQEPEAAAVPRDADTVDSVEIPVQEPESAYAELPDHAPEVAADMQREECVDDSSSAQKAPDQPNEISTPIQSVSVTDKYSLLLDKAMELIGDGKYIYALQLLEVCLGGPSSFSQQKQADILSLECLILSEQYDRAQKKWLEVLNKMYILESTDKIRLKQLLSTLNSRNKRVS